MKLFLFDRYAILSSCVYTTETGQDHQRCPSMVQPTGKVSKYMYQLYLYLPLAMFQSRIVSKFRQFENQHNKNTGPCVTKTVTVGFFLS